MGIVVIFVSFKNVLIIQKTFTQHLLSTGGYWLDMLLHAVKSQPTPSHPRSLACFYQ